jgi:hypothetical protein
METMYILLIVLGIALSVVGILILAKKYKAWKKITAILVTAGIVSSGVILLPLQDGKNGLDEWIIDGDTVYVNDSMVYASATPHTISDGDFVEFEFISKRMTQ